MTIDRCPHVLVNWRGEQQCDLWGRYEDGKCYRHSEDPEARVKRMRKAAKQMDTAAAKRGMTPVARTILRPTCDARLPTMSTHVRCQLLARYPDGRCVHHTAYPDRPLHRWRITKPPLPDISTWTPEARAMLLLTFAAIEQV